MKNYKKLFIIILSVLMVAFISCVETVETTSYTPTNPENPIRTFRLSELIGTWTNAVDTNTFILQEETNAGSIIINSSELVRLLTWDKNKESSLYVCGQTAFYVTNEKKLTGNRYYFQFSGTDRIECKLQKNYGSETLYYKQ